MLDARSGFTDVMKTAESLLARAKGRVETSKVAKAVTVSEKVAALDQAVAETQANALNVLAKFAHDRRLEQAKRAEKVKIAVHIAQVASRLAD